MDPTLEKEVRLRLGQKSPVVFSNSFKSLLAYRLSRTGPPGTAPNPFSEGLVTKVPEKCRMVNKKFTTHASVAPRTRPNRWPSPSQAADSKSFFKDETEDLKIGEGRQLGLGGLLGLADTDTLDQLRQRHRTPEQIALDDVTAHPLQSVQDFLILDAFGDDLAA